MYEVLDPVAFAQWVSILCDNAGGATALARQAMAGFSRQRVHEWLAWGRGAPARREVSVLALDGLMMCEANPWPAVLTRDAWWIVPPLVDAVRPPAMHRRVAQREFYEQLERGPCETRVEIPFAPVWAHDARAFGPLGAARLARGLPPWDDTASTAQRWPVYRWIAVNVHQLEELRRGAGSHMETRPASDAPSFVGAAAFVAWRWSKHVEAIRRAAAGI